MNRFKGKAAEQSLQRKSAIEQSLLQELLPKAALLMLFSLTNDDKEVLIFLVLFGRNALLNAEASVSVGKSPLKAWKGLPSKASHRLQVCPSCPFSDALFAFIPPMEDVVSKKSQFSSSKHKKGGSCDCFSSYATFWSRWNSSPNRDTISKILDIVESSPLSTESTPPSKGKKKKKVDRRKELLDKKPGRDEPLHSVKAIADRDWTVNDEVHCELVAKDMSGNPLVNTDSLMTSIALKERPIASDGGPSDTSNKNSRGGKKRLFGGIKRKDKSGLYSPNNSTIEATGGVQNAVPMVTPGLGQVENCTGAVAIEIPENLTLGISPAVALGPSLVASQGKKNSKPHRLGMRRSNQVLPVDCDDEDVVAPVRDEEAVIVVDNAPLPASPRVADAGLGGRGFLARVFPDALGRVASRLWDLISFRLRSHSVEYH